MHVVSVPAGPRPGLYPPRPSTPCGRRRLLWPPVCASPASAPGVLPVWAGWEPVALSPAVGWCVARACSSWALSCSLNISCPFLRSRSGAMWNGPMTMSCGSSGHARPQAPSLSTSAPRAPRSSTSSCRSEAGGAHGTPGWRLRSPGSQACGHTAWPPHGVDWGPETVRWSGGQLESTPGPLPQPARGQGVRWLSQT